MDDLKVLRDLGVSLDPETQAPPAGLRHRVLTEAGDVRKAAPSWGRRAGRLAALSGGRLAALSGGRLAAPSGGRSAAPSGGRSAAPSGGRSAVPSGGQLAAPSRGRWAAPRWGRRLGLAGALASVLTGGILVTQVVPFGHRAPASTASAADILHNAAAEARRQPAVAVRGDQFIYVKSIATSMSLPESGSGRPTSVSTRRQAWLSADGTRDGLLRQEGDPVPDGGKLPGCRDGVITLTKGDQSVRSACTPTPSYRGDLPTDADSMLAYLYRNSGGDKNPRDQQAFTAAGDLIREAYLAPATLSAVYGALAKIPGVRVAGEVTDEAGRPGVALARAEVQGTLTELIFDPKNFTYLGERSVLTRDDAGLTAGETLNSTAVLKVAVVDQAGQQP